jgi:energy-coupling factor transporter ATP-binding protein EcfA2
MAIGLSVGYCAIKGAFKSYLGLIIVTMVVWLVTQITAIPITIYICEITPLLHSTLESCSLGMLQRVALASMLVLDPDVIIFDEPRVHRDQAGQQFFIKLCQDLKKQGKTLIILDYSLVPYHEIADQIVILEAGKIVHDGPVDGMINPHYLLDHHIYHLVNDVVTTSQGVYTIEEATRILAGRLKL